MAATKSLCIALLAMVAIASAQGSPPATARFCRQTVAVEGTFVLDFLNTQICDRPGFLRSLRRMCTQGLCSGQNERQCTRTLRRAGRTAVGPFCDPPIGFEDLPQPIVDNVALDVGFQVPVTCWPSKVCIRATHTFVADLRISIRSPNNEPFILQSNKGAAGNDIDACYSNDFDATVADSRPRGQPRISGNFIPEDLFPTSPVPGAWVLRVNDRVDFDFGTLDFVDVDFECNS